MVLVFNQSSGKPRRGRGLQSEQISATAVERFFQRYTVQPNGCWEWQSTRNKRGYGMLALHWRPGTKEKHSDGAHRVSWVLHFCDIPPGNSVVMHTCDNPSCCNPAHLSLGTQRDNIRDASRKGRLPKDHLRNGQESARTQRRKQQRQEQAAAS